MSGAASASVTFSFSLPPESIREFFEGWSKVESAKRGSSDFDWSALLPFIPLAIPIISNLMKGSASNFVNEFDSPSVRVPKPKDANCDACPFATYKTRVYDKVPLNSGPPCSPCPMNMEDCPPCPPTPPCPPCPPCPDNDEEEMPDVIISMMAKSSDKEREDLVDEVVSMVSKMPQLSMLKEMTESELKEFKDNIMLHMSKSKEQECESDVKEDSRKEESKQNSDENKRSSKSSRPAYKEGENVIDLKNLPGALGPGAEGIADMMKMFGPMLSGLMGGFPGMPKMVQQDEEGEQKNDSKEACSQDEQEGDKKETKDDGDVVREVPSWHRFLMEDQEIKIEDSE